MIAQYFRTSFIIFLYLLAKIILKEDIQLCLE
jgi:hypothetical protein